MNILHTGLIAITIGLVSSIGLVMAGGTHSHDHENMNSPKAMGHMDKEKYGGGGHGDKGGHGDMGSHAHSSWQKPPEQYASLVNKKWDDVPAAKRGGQFYAQQCLACHGADGKGTGPAAAALEHPPADLTNNFHTAPGEGDGYLFWRISEGGVVEPFSSMKSSMPPFKTILSEQQRWDVLTYIHQEFHGGFTKQPGRNKQSDHDVKQYDHKDHSH